jgi:hypothetical protein
MAHRQAHLHPGAQLTPADTRRPARRSGTQLERLRSGWHWVRAGPEWNPCITLAIASRPPMLEGRSPRPTAASERLYRSRLGLERTQVRWMGSSVRTGWDPRKGGGRTAVAMVESRTTLGQW